MFINLKVLVVTPILLSGLGIIRIPIEEAENVEDDMKNFHKKSRMLADERIL